MEQARTASRTYGGLSAEERRATRRRTLIDTALDLFIEGGSDAVSKRAVCARARLNERYFHEHFSNADALLEAIIQQQTADVLEVVAAAGVEAGDDLTDQVSAIARTALEYLAADPRRGALLLGSYSSEVLQRTKRASVMSIAKVVTTLFPDPDGSASDTAAAELVAYALVSGAWELIAGWLRGELEISTEGCAELVTGLLLATPRVTPATRPVPTGAGRSNRGGRP